MIDIFSNKNFKNIFYGLFYNFLFLIILLLGIFVFKIINCIYFMRIQPWKICTLVKILRIILWNICILIIISNFEKIISNKEYLKIITKISLPYINTNKKTSTIIDFFYKNLVETNFKYLYNVLFRLILDIIFKNCLLNSLRFYFIVETLIFVLFKNKYTIPYSMINMSIFLLAVPHYNFCHFPNIKDKDYNNTSDFTTFCYILIFFFASYLYLYIYYMKLSLFKKINLKENKIKFIFCIMICIGYIMMISLLFDITRNNGEVCKLKNFF